MNAALAAYRPDIDGLRGIAVLLVVLYHAFPSVVPSGFIGVDIFFVISGFLISNIIFNGINDRTFSFSHFYARRIKRIFPALILVLTVCLVVGWFILLQEEYQQLAKHTQGSVIFISNFLLWLESGYFDTSAEVKPLLHLWSLGIEEQFYLVWPLVLWIGFKLRFNLLFLITALAASSFLINIWLLRTNAISAFYLPQSRCWELLTGSLVAYLTNPMLTVQSDLIKWLQKKVLGTHWFYRLTGFIGLALLIVATVRIDQTKVFPGYWALLPTIGTACLIYSGQISSSFARILKNPLLVWFGLISFPLYLWHWPLLVFARITQSDVPHWSIRTAIVFASIILAWVTYQSVEKRFRSETNTRLKLRVLIGAMLCIGVISTVLFIHQGVYSRSIVLNTQRLKATANDGGTGIQLVGQCGLAQQSIPAVYHCLSDPRESPKFALIGDSKALALLPGLIRTSQENERWLSINGINPAFTKSLFKEKDEKTLRLTLDAITRNPDIKVVAIVNAARTLLTPQGHDEKALMRADNFDSVLKDLDLTIYQLVHSGKKVILVLDNPTLANPEDCLARNFGSEWISRWAMATNSRCSISVARHVEITSQYRRLFETIEQKYPDDISIFDTMPFVCDTSVDKCSVFKNNRLMYSYTDHVSDYAAGLIGKSLNELAWQLGR